MNTKDGIDLSILICSLNRRVEFLTRLKSIIKPQLQPNVEVLCSIDDGEASIGAKRQSLLEKSSGKYIAFIDDDDRISDDYVELVLKAIEKDPDVIGMHLIMSTDNKLTGKTYHSLKYKSWYDEPGDNPSWRYYYRNPNHLNPIKREHAIQIGFPPISMGEDKMYSMAILPFLKTEEYIDSPIYYYEVRPNKIV